jgi:hypothetical protein
VVHIVERDSQNVATSLQFCRSLLDNPFKTIGCFGALGEQSVELDGISAKDFYGASHCADLVCPNDGHSNVPGASGNRGHDSAKLCEARDNISTHVKPDNEY